MTDSLTLKDDMILPVGVLEAINEAVAKIQKELSTADKGEYHVDAVKLGYINGGFDLQFRFRHNEFGLAKEVFLD